MMLSSDASGANNTLSVELLGSKTEMQGAKNVLADLRGLELEVSEGHPEGAHAPGIGGARVVMLAFGADEEGSLELLRGVSRRLPRPTVVALLNERSAVLMRAVLRAGADEILFLPLDTAPTVRT